MTEKPALTQLLKMNAGLSDQAALVYNYILIVGSLTIGEVTEYTGLSYEEASKALDGLVDKKLVRKLAHVVNRYVAVAPYRAFAELLVEFQRTMKELEENARKSIDSTLTEISKTNEEWKASSIKLRDEQVNQAKQDIRLLREEAGNARKTLIEKLRRETEAKKSSLTDMLKKHVEEHTARISEVKKDVTLKVDNSVAKFAETATKLEEQVSQTATSYLGKFDEKLKLFLVVINDNLTTLQSDFSCAIENFQGLTSAFLEDSNTKLRELTENVKIRTNDLIHEVEESFTQLSTELQGTVSSNVDSSIGAVTATKKDLELILTNAIKTHGEKLIETISNFQAKTKDTIDGWRSTAKEEMQNKLNLLTQSIGSHMDNLTQKIESTIAPIPELMKSHLASAEVASNDLSSNIVTLTESLKGDLTSKTSSTDEELQESCDAVAKECGSLVTALETLSKKNVPLASKTITDFTSDVNGKLSKMRTSLLTEAKSFAVDVREKMLETVSDVLEAYQSRGSPTESGRKGAETQLKGSALKKEVSKKIDETTSTYIDELKESIETLDKYASGRISATLGFEKELSEKWDTIAGTLDKVSELADDIKSFPQTISKFVNELVDQYNKKADGTVATTKRLLNVHSTTLGDTISSTTKKWSTTVEKIKKEIADISTKRQDGLNELISKQISTIEKITADRSKALADLVSQRIESIKSDSLVSETTISRQVGSDTETIEGLLKDIEGKLKDGLRSSHESFKAAIDLKSKENEELSAAIINKTGEAIANLKQQLASMVNTEEEQVKRVCENTNSKLNDTTSEQSKELHEIVTSAARSFGEIVYAASEGYKKESESIKGFITSALSLHLKNYADSVIKVIGEMNTTFTKHFEDCNELTEKFGIRLDELLTTHQDKYERASIKLVEELADCIDQDEAAINNTSQRMLREFTDNTTKSAKEAGSVENLMRTAWAEIIDTQQINADKTWHYVTKQAILNHMKDMVKRTKSTVTIVVPNLDEAPIKEVKEISKAIRINIIAGIDETFHKKLLKELFAQGNVRLWKLTEKDYISCTRDAEEVLIAPVARKDTDCVATVSIEENYVKLYHKFIGPMWMASSREIKERTLG